MTSTEAQRALKIEQSDCVGDKNNFNCSYCTFNFSVERKFKCNSCDSSLYCETCITAHLRQKHDVCDGRGYEPTICDEHCSLLVLFCRTCNLCYCWSCSYKHSSHKLGEIKDAVVTSRKEVFSLLERAEKVVKPLKNKRAKNERLFSGIKNQKCIDSNEVMDKLKPYVEEYCNILNEEVEVERGQQTIRDAEKEMEQRVVNVDNLTGQLRGYLGKCETGLINSLSENKSAIQDEIYSAEKFIKNSDLLFIQVSQTKRDPEQFRRQIFASFDGLQLDVERSNVVRLSEALSQFRMVEMSLHDLKFLINLKSRLLFISDYLSSEKKQRLVAFDSSCLSYKQEATSHFFSISQTLSAPKCFISPSNDALVFDAGKEFESFRVLPADASKLMFGESEEEDISDYLKNLELPEKLLKNAVYAIKDITECDDGTYNAEFIYWDEQSRSLLSTSKDWFKIDCSYKPITFVIAQSFCAFLLKENENFLLKIYNFDLPSNHFGQNTTVTFSGQQWDCDWHLMLSNVDESDTVYLFSKAWGHIIALKKSTKAGNSGLVFDKWNWHFYLKIHVQWHRSDIKLIVEKDSSDILHIILDNGKVLEVKLL